MPHDDRDASVAVPSPAAFAGRAPRPAGDTPAQDAERPESLGDDSTGDAGVDEALGRLAELDDLPVRDHVAVFDAVHAALQDRLADVED